MSQRRRKFHVQRFNRRPDHPFRQGKLDEEALARLVEWHIEQGTHGIVPVGTTGESPTLTHDEHCRVVELVVKLVAAAFR